MTVEHPTAGPLDLVASPIWGATRTEATAPPLLGEHTAEVLGELGRSPEDIDALAAQGVIGDWPRRGRRLLVRLARARCRRAGLLGE